MRAPLIVDHGMNLIDDQRAHGAQYLAPAFAGQKDVKRFRRGNNNMWRFLGHRHAVFRRRITRTHQRANFDPINSCRFEILLNAFKRRFQVDLNVVAQRLERRDIYDIGFVREMPASCLPNEIVDGRQKCCQCLA